jgi:hypothetical protein
VVGLSPKVGKLVKKGIVSRQASLRGTKQPLNYTERIEKFKICKAGMSFVEVASYLAMTPE